MQRAKSELVQHEVAGRRSWMVTLTCRPDVHYRHLAEARLAYDLQDGFVVHQQTGVVERSPSWEQLSPEEQWRKRCGPLAVEATKYLKRVRKETGSQFRYLMVTEVHLGGGENHGQPHLHLLMHEINAEPLRERVLRGQWPHGHAKAKLVTTVEGGTYLCKYLSKDARARVRASARYGEWEASAAKRDTPQTAYDRSPQDVTNSPHILHEAGLDAPPRAGCGGEPPPSEASNVGAQAPTAAALHDFVSAVRSIWPDLEDGAVRVTASNGEEEQQR